ncbi:MULTISPECIES: DUF402 domain-containing protein [unclassified Streptomyces]|uniref:DUF402 domain-containing protein n=1 Tax=unclassified Streptomyces TaxID=2593676 RepID=UPI0034537840
MPSPSAEAGPPADALTVVLTKAGRVKKRYPARRLADDGTHLVAEAPWASPEARDFGFVRFAPGDVFTEHYWTTTWYAIKEVRAADGGLKGWYCDMTRPAVREEGTVRVDDLELDLWVPAPGRGPALRLDEDEFLASGLPTTDPHAAERARSALAALEALARRDGDRTAFRALLTY